MKRSGFTLIELIIALTIISILGLISYPMYSKQLMRSRRLHIRTLLLDSASRLEQYYLIHNTYDGTNLAINNIPDKNLYEIKIDTKDNQYLLEAIPIGKQKDDPCRTLSIDQDGNTGERGVDNCWR